MHLTLPLYRFPIVPCKTPNRNLNNRCTVVRGGLSIYTDNGGGKFAMDDVEGVLKVLMEYGLFNYNRMGIVRVSLFEE